MPTEYRLTIIQDPGIYGRKTLAHTNAPNPLLVEGHDLEAPDLCCGQCGAILATRIHRKAFYPSNNAVMNQFKPGTYIMNKPLDVPSGQPFGPAVLKCLSCGCFNDPSPVN